MGGFKFQHGLLAKMPYKAPDRKNTKNFQKAPDANHPINLLTNTATTLKHFKQCNKKTKSGNLCSLITPISFSHCCTCKKEFLTEQIDFIHCEECCLEYSKTQKHCCDCAIIIPDGLAHCHSHQKNWDASIDNHCCNCNSVYNKSLSHCCNCQRNFDGE